MKTNKIIPILLSGGTGSRLWPLSRESFPKQYQSISHNTHRSLLQMTQERISDLKNTLAPIIICNEEHRFIVAQQMKEINIKPLSILLEPSSKNTAPAVTIAALKALEIDADPLLLFLSADHNIKNKDKFIEVINEAVSFAERGRLVAFGVTPTCPETGYGYIESEKPFLNNIKNGYKIVRFIEKPDLEKAEQLIKDRRFLWNSGIFLFKASSILRELEKFAPKILSSCKESLKDQHYDLDFQRLERKSFELCEKISIDVAVMEKTNLGTVLPLNVGWSDIGNWESLWKYDKKDKNNNVITGKVLTTNSKNSYIRSESKLIVCLGIKNLIVVETNDAILVTDKDLSQDVKQIVEKLNLEGFTEAKIHKKIYRPWGHYQSIENGDRWQIKKIVVNPNEALSLQMHHHRSEHWIIVNGTAKVEINEKEKLLEENQSVYIPLASKHRLSNPGKVPLVLIEVQSGSYLGEDDIVRFKDDYGRNIKPK